MERSLFGTLQSWIKREAGSDFGGRYLAQLIGAVSVADPKPFRDFLLTTTRDRRFQSAKFSLETEFGFGVGGRRRRADIAVLLDGVPCLLIELKYRDRLSEGANGSSQLNDYLTYSASSGLKFLLLHREAQESTVQRAIRRANGHIQPYQALVPFLSKSKNPLSQQLLSFLREEGMVIEQIDIDHLSRFFTRLVLPWQGSGRINTARGTQDGPLHFQRLINNMRLIAAEITPKIRSATNSVSTRSATIEFSLTHRFSKRRLSRHLSKVKREKEVEADAKIRTSGTVEVWAQQPLRRLGSWLYLYYGFEFSMAVGKPMAVTIYAQVLSPEIEKVELANCMTGELSSTYLSEWKVGELEADFLGLVRDAAKEVLKHQVLKDGSALSTLRRLAIVS